MSVDEWIAGVRQQGYSDQQIYQMLVSQGYTPQAASQLIQSQTPPVQPTNTATRPRIHLVPKKTNTSQTNQHETAPSQNQQNQPQKKHHTVLWTLLILGFLTIGGLVFAGILFLEPGSIFGGQLDTTPAQPSQPTQPEPVEPVIQEPTTQTNTTQQNTTVHNETSNNDDNDTDNNNQVNQTSQDNETEQNDEEDIPPHLAPIIAFIENCYQNNVDQDATQEDIEIATAYCHALGAYNFNDEQICQLIDEPQNLITVCLDELALLKDDDDDDTEEEEEETDPQEAYLQEVTTFIETCYDSEVEDGMSDQELDQILIGCFIEAVLTYDDESLCDYIEPEGLINMCYDNIPDQEENGDEQQEGIDEELFAAIEAFITECFENLIAYIDNPTNEDEDGIMLACFKEAVSEFDEPLICTYIDDYTHEPGYEEQCTGTTS